MIYTRKNKLIICILIFLMLFGAVFTAAMNIAFAYSGNKFDNTNVLDDLKSSTVDGKPFDINAYPYDSTGLVKSPSVINFVEYCYSFKVNMQSNFGLYIYFYNPQALELDTQNKGNKIQLAVKYNSEGAPTDYEKFDLQFCSVSTEPNYYRLFYKFKIVDRKGADGKTIVQRVNSNERRYDISGAELVTKGNKNAAEYPIGGTYKFTGYVAGYGSDPNAPSNIKSTVTELETISLDVRSSNFRTTSSAAGKDHQNQLESVYFSVDNSILEKYGKLQKVKAEWYEYKTAPIIVISDKEIYDTFNGYVGVNNGEYSDGLRYKLGYGRNVFTSPGTTIINYDWSYNVKCYSNIGISTFIVDSKDKCNLLPYLFYTGGTSVKDYSLPGQTLKEWIYGYDKSHNSGYLPIKNGLISADLFSENVDSGRIKGYNCVEIDASEKYDLLSYTSNHGFWDKVGDYGFWATVFGKVPTDENVFGIEPIYTVKDKDISFDDNGIANNLLLSVNDVADFKNYYNDAKKADKTTFIFRYAVTDYFAGNIDIDDKQNTSGMLIKDKAYMAKETVFMDFDIIQLTFNKEGVYHVIPVVSNPIDVVGAITPPVEFEANDWWKILLGLILLVVLLVILAPVLPIIFRGLFWIICLPFKAIGALFNSAGKKTRKPKKEKRVKEKKPKKINIKKKESGTIDDKNDDWYLDDMDLWEEME